MDIVKNIGGWAKGLAEAGLHVIALGGGLSGAGLLGLVGAFFLYHIFNRK